MPTSPQDLFAFLDRLGIRHTTVSHPPLFTVADSQSLRGQIPGGHTKNLFLKDKGGALFLIVADEEARIELKSIHHRIGGKRVSFGAAELLMQHLGVMPGSVTPFAAINDTKGAVSVVLDTAMMGHEVLNFHPFDQHHDHDHRGTGPGDVSQGDRPRTAHPAGVGRGLRGRRDALKIPSKPPFIAQAVVWTPLSKETREERRDDT
jgi:Ala-tRNA(Pro) deacylase